MALLQCCMEVIFELIPCFIIILILGSRYFVLLAQLINFFSYAASGLSSSVISHQASFKSADSHGIEPLVDSCTFNLLTSDPQGSYMHYVSLFSEV